MDSTTGIKLISFDTFSQVDIRIGKVLTAEPLEGSEKLYVLTVDLGELHGTVEILTGIRQWYTPEELIQHTFLFVANLEPRKMLGKLSHGMILAVDTPERPELISIDAKLAPGLRLR